MSRNSDTCADIFPMGPLDVNGGQVLKDSFLSSFIGEYYCNAVFLNFFRMFLLNLIFRRMVRTAKIVCCSRIEPIV